MPRIAGSAPSTARTVTLSARLPTRTAVVWLDIGTSRPPVSAVRADIASGRVDVTVRPGMGVAGFGASAPGHICQDPAGPASQTPSNPKEPDICSHVIVICLLTGSPGTAYAVLRPAMTA